MMLNMVGRARAPLLGSTRIVTVLDSDTSAVSGQRDRQMPAAVAAIPVETL